MKLITILIYLQERRCFKHKIKKVIVGDYGGSTMICPICHPECVPQSEATILKLDQYY
jgi:hypothetical protein